MCDKCDAIQSEVLEQLEDTNIGVEDIAPQMINVFDKEPIDNITFDTEEFARGVKEYSYLAGKISALVNCGLTPEMAWNYIINVETMAMTKEMNIEMAKLGAFVKEKDSL